MSTRSRAKPWFRAPGERYAAAVRQIDARFRVSNADPPTDASTRAAYEHAFLERLRARARHARWWGEVFA